MKSKYPLEKPIILNKPSPEALKLAQKLTGYPQIFSEEENLEFDKLLKFGIAVKFEDGGWARGHAWRTYIKP